MSESPAAVTPTRLDRRKARTRGALVKAARSIISEGRAASASIQDITDTADIGFGSFYNHFDSKDELFRAAAQEVLEEWGDLIDGVTAPIEDPREVFAVSLRVSGRLAWTHDEIARVIVNHGFDFTDTDTDNGLAPRAFRDLQIAKDAGAIDIASVPLTLAMVGGAIIGVLRMRIEHPDIMTPNAADEMARQLLCMIGVPADEARELASRPLPAGAPD